MDQNTAILIEKILRLKQQKNTVILAHNYQISEIQDIADYCGDSLELAKISKDLECSRIIFCGVRFMAETAKILSPHKRVFLPVWEAGCPLADTIQPEQLIALKKKHPHAFVVAYVNTSAEIKALSDVCCTSSNAVTVVKNVPRDQVIFIPDKNLGWWVTKNVPEKEIILWNGYCYVHEQFTVEDLYESKKMYPDSEVLVHPECRKEILEKAEYVLSTSGMLKRVKISPRKQFIIGTEEGLMHKLKKENTGKEFFSLGRVRTCVNMKKTTLVNLFESLQNDIYEIVLERKIIDEARIALERMVQYV